MALRFQFSSIAFRRNIIGIERDVSSFVSVTFWCSSAASRQANQSPAVQFCIDSFINISFYYRWIFVAFVAISSSESVLFCSVISHLGIEQYITWKTGTVVILIERRALGSDARDIGFISLYANYNSFLYNEMSFPCESRSSPIINSTCVYREG